MAESNYRYSAFDANGSVQSGTLQASSKDQAMELLARRGLTVSEIKELGSGTSAIVDGSLRSVSTEELAAFAYELSALLQAGLSLAPALELLIKDGDKSAMAAVTLALLRDVRAGTPFSAALDRYPQVFPPMFAALVRAGEGTGGLEKALAQVSDFLEKADEVRNKIISSLAYPVTVCGMALAIITALFLFMVPRLREIYGQIGVPIPPLTAMALKIGQWGDTLAVGIVVVFIVSLPALRAYLRSQTGRRTLDAWKLRLPLLGDVFSEIALASFNKTLAILHESGVAMPQAVSLAAAVSGNYAVQVKYEAAVASLREGQSLATAFTPLNLYSDKMLGMLDAGEKSGNLSQMLGKMAEFAEHRTQHKVERLMALLEPLTIGLLGGMVGAAVLILGAPLLSLSSNIN